MLLLAAVVALAFVLAAPRTGGFPHTHLQSTSMQILSTVSGPYGPRRVTCSGNHLGHGFVLTAAHCIGEAMAWRSGGAKDHATVTLWADQPHDVALIFVRAARTLPSVAIDCRPMGIGENVEAIGSPHGYQNVHSRGTIASVGPHRALVWREAQFVSVITAGGNSGGMVVDGRGRLRGIVVGGLEEYTIIVPSPTLCRLMASDT